MSRYGRHSLTHSLTDRQTDRVMAVEKAVTVVMQESGRRALFDATQRLGANYRERPVLSSQCKVLIIIIMTMVITMGVDRNCSVLKCQQELIYLLIRLLILPPSSREKNGRREKENVRDYWSSELV